MVSFFSPYTFLEGLIKFQKILFLSKFSIFHYFTDFSEKGKRFIVRLLSNLKVVQWALSHYMNFQFCKDFSSFTVHSIFGKFQIPKMKHFNLSFTSQGYYFVHILEFCPYKQFQRNVCFLMGFRILTN